MDSDVDNSLDPEALTGYITSTFAGVEVVPAADDRFFFYDPVRDSNPARRLPFATIVTSDAYDDVSQLDRPGVFRLNIGVGKQTFDALFGAPATSGHAGETTMSDHDFAALDRIMPHPVYGTMFWVCVLNPSPDTFRAVQPLLAEAYDRSVQQHARARSRHEPQRRQAVSHDNAAKG